MTTKSLLAPIGILLLTPFALLAFLFIAFLVITLINVLLNNATLHKFEQSYAEIEHPALSKSHAMKSAVGNLGRASNHCDYLVAELRSSPQIKEEIMKHYEGLSIRSPDVFPNSYTPIQLWFFDKEIQVIDKSDALFNSPKNWGAGNSTFGNNSPYIVSAIESGAAPGADFRCH